MDTLTDEQAEAMLKQLAEHYSQPVMPINRYCDGIRTWVEVVQESCLPGRGNRRPEYADMLPKILLDISKSNLLARILYGGEVLRTMPCPEHRGVWSGITECAYGCGSTGWLPDPSKRPSRDAIVNAIDRTTEARDRGRERWGESWNASFYESDIKTYRAMLEYFYPTTPGTGIDAPYVPKHRVIVYLSSHVHKYGAKRFTRSVDVGVRLDFDPRLRTGQSMGKEIHPVPDDTIAGVVAYTAAIFGDPSFAALFGAPLTTNNLESMLTYASTCGRSGLRIGGGSKSDVDLPYVEHITRTLRKAVKDAVAPGGCEATFDDCVLDR